jgi:hypothetical protein
MEVCQMGFTCKHRIGPGVRIAAALVFSLTIAVSGAAQGGPDTNQGDLLSREDYVSLCEQIAVSELTEGADEMTGRHVSVTGQILVFEEREGDGIVTHLIIAVEDPAMTLPSGLLPVYVVHDGTIMGFIYDTVSIYGEVYCNDVYQSVAIQEKTLPRVDAYYIDE